MKTNNQIYRHLQKYASFLITAMVFFELSHREACAKNAPLSLSFSFTNQAADATTPQPLLITLDHSMSNPARCNIKLTAQAYTNVSSSSSPSDFTISATNISIASLPTGETVRQVQVAFVKDGEYRVFGEASTDKEYAASQGYCFIVRDGKVYGARFFDDCEGVIILNNAMRTKGGTNDVDELQRQYEQRLQEREVIKKKVRTNTKGGSGINTGETVTILANWKGPKVTGGTTTTVFPVLNCKIEIWRNALLQLSPIAQGIIQNGQFTFTSPDDDIDFTVKLIMDFPGFSGNSKFSVKKEGILGFPGSIYDKTFTWDDSAFQRTGNQFTYTAPFHNWTNVDTDAEKFDSAWGTFHGIQEIFRAAYDELTVAKSSDVNVIFPITSGTTRANATTVYVLLGDRYDFDVCAHEIGHSIDGEKNISAYVVRSWSGEAHSGGNQYDLTSNSGTYKSKSNSLQLAFGEGFATYWGVSLLEQSTYLGKLANIGDKIYNDTEDRTVTYELEPIPNSLGEDTEQAIAALLWDIHDSNNEDYGNGLSDGLAKGLGGMWNILKHTSGAERYENVSDFWLRNWLPGGDFTKLSLGSLDAAPSFTEMGMAPRITHPDNNNKVDLSQLQSNELRFDWVNNTQTGDAVLTLNDYDVVIYKGDLSSIVWQKHVGDVNTYTLTDAEKDDLHTAVGSFAGDLIAVVFGKNTPNSGSGIITTGPYASQGVRLARGSRYMALAVDSSSSMSWNDTNNLRIAAAKTACDNLVSQAAAQAQNKIADKACGVDFDDAIESTFPFSDPPDVKPWLNTVDSIGNTRIDLGIHQAVSMITAEQVGGGQTEDHAAVLLFTDGENNDGDAPVIAAINYAWTNGVRVHYGWLQPGKVGLTTYAKSTKGSPSTIEEAVRMTGGNYGVIRDADSQSAFVGQVFNNGLTVIDSPKDTTAGGNIAGHVETPNDLAGSYRIQAYRFNGQANERIRILLQAADFDPIVSVFDKSGGYVAVDYDDDGNRSIALPIILSYSGEYVVEVRGKGSQFGKYTLLVEVENAPPFVDVTGNTTTGLTNWVLDRASGALVGSLILQNNTGSPKTLKQKFWYVLPSTANVRLANPDGVDANGNPYVDVTAAVEVALPSVGNGDMNLDPGESVTITGIRFYSKDRSVPAGFVFAVWADPPPETNPVVVPSRLSTVTVSKNSPTGIVLSWMATKGNVLIEESDSSNPTNWHVVSQIQNIEGDKVKVAIPISTGAKFYRLRQN